MHTPRHHWLAAKLLKIGTEPSLATLGLGVLARHQTGSQEQVSDMYTVIRDYDSLAALREYWAHHGAAHDYLLPAVTPLLTFAEANDPADAEKVARAAHVLHDVDLDGAQNMAGGDLLGQVYFAMLTIGRQVNVPQNYHPATIETAVAEAAPRILNQRNIPFFAGARFLDGWCASGVRVIAMAMICDALGVDPNSVEWVGNDYNPIYTALAAINLSNYGLLNVEFTNNPGAITKDWLAGGGVGDVAFADEAGVIATDDWYGYESSDVLKILEIANATREATILAEIDLERARVSAVLNNARQAAETLSATMKGTR